MSSVSLKKGTDSSHVITFERPDGTTTWSKIDDFFVTHDLMHYAVESVLKFDEGFIGLMMSGWTVEGFEEKQKDTGRTRDVPKQAMDTEYIVTGLGLWRSSSPDADPLEIIAMSGVDLATVPQLTKEAVDAIMAKHKEFVLQWMSLKQGETIELPWPAG